MSTFEILWKDPKNELVINTMTALAYSSDDAKEMVYNFVCRFYGFAPVIVGCRIVPKKGTHKSEGFGARLARLFRRKRAA